MDFEAMIDEMRAERQSMLLEILELRERCKLLGEENESFYDEARGLREELRVERDLREQAEMDRDVAKDDLEGTREALRQAEKLSSVRRDELEGERQSYSALSRLLDGVRNQRDEQARRAELNFAMWAELRDGLNALMADKG